MNYTTETTSAIQLLWRRSGGPLEIVPREALHARGRRDYYSFGGAVVAMKEGVMASVTRTLSYLHGDHLGSASLTTNASGQKVSEQRYKPYGEVRWSSGAGMPTDKQFTSQIRLTEGYVGTLYDYVARAYDPVLGRFISADTIVPGAGNPQAFNRYMYALGNPLGFLDPSGHLACPTSDTSGCQEYMDYIHIYGKSLRDDLAKGLPGAVEALGRLADYAWVLADKDVHTFMWGMTQLLNGWDIHVSDYALDNARNRLANTGVGHLLGVQREETPQTRYFLGPDAFGFAEKDGPDGQSDWSLEYYDGTRGQAYHFWAYVAISAKNGTIAATYAVAEHDPPDSPRSRGMQQPLGISREDYELGVAAVDFYEYQSKRPFCFASYCLGSPPGNPGDWIRENLKAK